MKLTTKQPNPYESESYHKMFLICPTCPEKTIEPMTMTLTTRPTNGSLVSQIQIATLTVFIIEPCTS